jgi:hypothetical protein
LAMRVSRRSVACRSSSRLLARSLASAGLRQATSPSRYRDPISLRHHLARSALPRERFRSVTLLGRRVCIAAVEPTIARGLSHLVEPQRALIRFQLASRSLGRGHAVTAYKVPFKFTGNISQLTIELKEMKKADRDDAEQARKEAGLKKGLSD